MNIKNSFVFLFLLAAAAVVPAFGQNRSCPLDLSVIQYQSKQDANENPVSGATATATNLRSKKVFKATLLEGMPRFAELPEGAFTIVVTKAGYKRTTKEMTLDCQFIEDDGSVIEIISLQKGSSKLTYRMPRESKIPPRRLEVQTVVGDSSSGSVTSDGLPTTSDQVPAVRTSGNNSVKTVSGGVVNTKATNLVRPTYPMAARAVRASGAVNVQVTIDENGTVISASAVSGHPLLRQAAEQAARSSKFAPTLLSGQPVKVTGIIVYNFVP